MTVETVLDLPFGKLLRFAKDIDMPQPKVLVVAPLSGHFATLLAGTVRTMLQDHEVYITDWANARDVPVEAGSSASRITSTISLTSWRRLDPARMSWRSASRACRRWPQSR